MATQDIKTTAPPETASQAHTWERIKTHYLQLGLCHKCAAQAAYGSQYGFTDVNPPCVECSPTVAAFASKQPNGWRSQGRIRSRAGDPARLEHRRSEGDVYALDFQPPTTTMVAA
ncbi:hypothetical protein CIK75_02500 [Glutamicibacter sp. BW78]|nr:hypothetical protein CIK75_02500 [Glutamicibacter sp. BW78]